MARKAPAPTDAQRDALGVLADGRPTPARSLGQLQLARALHRRGYAVFDETAGTVTITDLGRQAAEAWPPIVPPAYDGADPVRRVEVPEFVGTRPKPSTGFGGMGIRGVNWRDLDDWSERLDRHHEAWKRARDEAARINAAKRRGQL